jgi:hypothetical protein
MKTDDEIWSDVNAWISGVTGVEAIRQWQGGPTPARPYIVTNLFGSVEVRSWPQDLVGEEDPESGRILGQPIIEMEWNFSIHAFGETPMNILRPLIAASKLTQVEEPLFPALVIADASAIRNLSEWHNEDWEPRAQIDLNFRGLTRDGHLIDTIEEIEGIRITRT